MSTPLRNPTWPFWALALAPLSTVVAFLLLDFTDNMASILIVYPFLYIPLFGLLLSRVNIGGRAWRIAAWLAAGTLVLLVPAFTLSVVRAYHLRPAVPIAVIPDRPPYPIDGPYNIVGLDYEDPLTIQVRNGEPYVRTPFSGLELNYGGILQHDRFGNSVSGTKTALGEITLHDSRGNVATIQWSGANPKLVASRTVGQSASVRGYDATGQRMRDFLILLLVLAPLLALIFLGFTIFAMTRQLNAWPAVDAVVASILLLLAASLISYAALFGLGGRSGDEKASAVTGFACLLLPLFVGGMADLVVRLILLTRQINKPMIPGFPVEFEMTT